MTSSGGLAVKKQNLYCHIVEEHNDALGHILKAIGSKKLVYEGNILVHFDSHPDLLTENLLHEDTLHKDLMLDAVSIETWIVPLLYAGHFNHVIWVKPPWSNQIHAHNSILRVGKHKRTNQVRLFSELIYFVGAGCCSPLSELENVKDISLSVISAKTRGPELIKVRNMLTENNGNYVLDIDLDFFSTLNPFLKMHEEVHMYEKLKDIFAFSINDTDPIEDQIARRAKQLSDMDSIFTHLNGTEGNLSTLDAIYQACAQGEALEKAKSLVTELKEYYSVVDWEFVGVAGTTIDDPDHELPHHVSTIDEIDDLSTFVYTLIDSFPLPKVITVARSTKDNYCPENQVEYIQAKIIEMLQTAFDAKINCDYFRFL